MLFLETKPLKMAQSSKMPCENCCYKSDSHHINSTGIIQCHGNTNTPCSWLSECPFALVCTQVNLSPSHNLSQWLCLVSGTDFTTGYGHICFVLSGKARETRWLSYWREELQSSKCSSVMIRKGPNSFKCVKGFQLDKRILKSKFQNFWENRKIDTGCYFTL